MQAISWACSAEPYRRVEAIGLANGNVANGNGASSVSHNKQSHVGVWQKFFDAFHLLCSARGIGWNWSKGLHVPAHTRPTSGRVIFLLYTTTSLIAHLMAMDIIHYYIQTFPQLHLTACPRGATIFAEELPPLQRYALSTYISLLAGPVIYCTVQLGYDLATIIGVGIFQQNPMDWPPMFDHPWKATSLRDFWAKRWHQFFRYIFVTLGSVPFSRILGRVGVPFGAFLISGIVHYFGLWGMSRGTDWRMIGFFLLMAVGIVMEDLWKQSTGRKVRGFYGWLWTTLWVVGWANILVDAWARKGLISSSFYPENYRPAELLFGPLTTTKAEVLC
ncbi:hypothetical protein VNI00_005138 [Paramarasmius palmivorus]|uniref:Wax synthase domain-containing protein n=1 Tax=Paramarasmius palmivorus TaxID=297713 RepID=A0AAW0DEN4_9AGAR